MRAGAYDVAIAGGGPAGAAAAIVLARAGRRVLLADAAGARRPHDDRPEDRMFKIGEGLPPSARHLLRELGALDRVLADGHRASHGTLAFWGSDAPHAEDFMFQLHGGGLQLHRPRFDAALLELAQAAGARIVRDAKLSLATNADGTDIHQLSLRGSEAGHIIESRWLIDASGRPATLARALGSTRSGHDALLAFHMRLASDGDSDQDGRTWVEAVENGWWYSALLPSRERLVAFLSDADLVDRRSLLTRAGLWAALARAQRLFAHCHAHGYVPSSQPHGADARSSHLDRAADDAKRWLAVGDAALAFDPLSSKGISNALYTGIRAAQAVIARENGDSAAAARYTGHLLDIHRAYRQQLRMFYTMETRWPASEFWRRRRDATDVPEGLPPEDRRPPNRARSDLHEV